MHTGKEAFSIRGYVWINKQEANKSEKRRLRGYVGGTQKVFFRRSNHRFGFEKNILVISRIQRMRANLTLGSFGLGRGGRESDSESWGEKQMSSTDTHKLS